MTPNKPLLWAELTWEQIAAMRSESIDLVLFPIGSTVQHGPHLPVGVDTISAEVVAHAVSSQTGVPVLPTMPFGCTRRHTHHWPGTLSLSPQTLSTVVCEVVADVIAHGFHRVLVLHGNLDDAHPLQMALQELQRDSPHAQMVAKHLYGASLRLEEVHRSDGENAHGGAAETALTMHIAPDLVHHDRIFDDPDRTRNLVFSYAAPQLSQWGHTGEPSKATPEMGQELFATLVRDWTYVVKKALNEQAPIRPLTAPPQDTSSTRLETKQADTSPPVQPPICGPPELIPQSFASQAQSGADLFRAPSL